LSVFPNASTLVKITAKKSAIVQNISFIIFVLIYSSEFIYFLESSMLLKHLINPRPSTILFFVVFCVLFVVFPIIKCDIQALFKHTHLHPLIVLFFGITIPFFISMGLNNIVYEKNIIRKENVVIGFVFILISTPFVNTVEAWISSFLLLFLFNFLVESYQKDLPFSQFFNASMILGLLTFIYPNLIFLLLLLIVSGINYSNINLRIVITILLGLITPYLFYFVFTFLVDLPVAWPKKLHFMFFHYSTLQQSDISEILWLGFLFLVSLVSFFELFGWLYKKSIKSRRTFMTIVWYFIICVLIAICSGGQYLYFSLMPLAIIVGNYFVYTKKRKIANGLFLIFLISSIYYKYMIAFNM